MKKWDAVWVDTYRELNNVIYAMSWIGPQNAVTAKWASMMKASSAKGGPRYCIPAEITGEAYANYYKFEGYRSTTVPVAKSGWVQLALLHPSLLEGADRFLKSGEETTTVAALTLDAMATRLARRLTIPCPLDKILAVAEKAGKLKCATGYGREVFVSDVGDEAGWLAALYIELGIEASNVKT